MKLTDRFTRPKHVMARVVGDETVILDLVSGTYFGLDPLGSRIWHLLDEGLSLAAISENLLEEYDVSSDVFQDDMLELVSELLAKGLILPLNEAQ